MEKVSWDDAQVFLTRLNAQQAGNLLLVGPMFYLPNRNGNMPVVRVRLRPIPGVMASPARMRIIVLRRPVMWACTPQTVGL